MAHNRDRTSVKQSEAQEASSLPPMALSEALRVYLGFVQGCSPGPLRMLLTHPCSHVSPWEISRCDTFQKVSPLMRTTSSLQGATVAWWLQPTSITPGQSCTVTMPPPCCSTKLINTTCIHHCPLHVGLTFWNAQQITPQGPLTPAYSFLPFKRICRVMTWHKVLFTNVSSSALTNFYPVAFLTGLSESQTDFIECDRRWQCLIIIAYFFHPENYIM